MLIRKLIEQIAYVAVVFLLSAFVNGEWRCEGNPASVTCSATWSK